MQYVKLGGLDSKLSRFRHSKYLAGTSILMVGKSQILGIKCDFEKFAKIHCKYCVQGSAVLWTGLTLAPCEALGKTKV